MKTLPIVLFFSGFLIQFAALLGEHLTEIPSALKIVAPSYCRARIGIETLLRERRLANTNEGFEEISRLLIWNMYEINHMPKDRKTDFKVDAIAPVGETVSKGTAQGDDLYTPDDVRCWMSTVTNHFVDSVGHIQKSLVFEYHQ